MYDAVYKNNLCPKTARQDGKILGNSTLLKKMNIADNKIIQRADEFIPNGDTEPHLHLHDGGVTYTGVGHRHTTIVSGQHVVMSSIIKVISELENSDLSNAPAIIDYLVNTYDIEVEDPDELKEKDLRYKLEEMSDIEIQGEILSKDPKISDQKQLFRWEDEINEQYEKYQEFIKGEAQVPNAIEARRVVSHYS